MNDSNVLTNEENVSAIVLRQHDEVASRLAAVKGHAGHSRQDEFEALAALLTVHEAAEESVIYPVLRELGDDGKRIADAREREEKAADEMLAKLKTLDIDSREFDSLFSDFSAAVHAHASSEKAEVIGLLNSSVSAHQLETMGTAFQESQKSVASRS